MQNVPYHITMKTRSGLGRPRAELEALGRPRRELLEARQAAAPGGRGGRP